jgi:hypothetical protein
MDLEHIKEVYLNVCRIVFNQYPPDTLPLENPNDVKVCKNLITSCALDMNIKLDEKGVVNDDNINMILTASFFISTKFFSESDMYGLAMILLHNDTSKLEELYNTERMILKALDYKICSGIR